MSMRIVPVGRAAAAVALLWAAVLTGCMEPYYSRPMTGLVLPVDPMTGEPVGNAASSELSALSGSGSTDGADAASSPATNPSAHQPRLMVYSARFELSVPNIDEAVDQLAARVGQMGGYVESRENARVVCRVPAEVFSELVDSLPSLGAIVNQTLSSQDVTRAHRDLGLRLETMEWSRRRILALLERAEKIEDVLRLEEELRRLTEEIERLQGDLRCLSEQIAYSTIEVLFRNAAVTPSMGGPSTHSPFAWVNQVGVEYVLAAFDSLEMSAEENPLTPALLLPGGVSLDVPEGFVLVERQRDQIKAVSPDESKLWLREFPATNRADLVFWSEALKNHLIHRRGYTLIEQRPVRDGSGLDGLELHFEVASRGIAYRYLVTLYVPDRPFWSSQGKIRVVEFLAPEPAFARHLQLVRRSTAPGTIEGRL